MELDDFLEQKRRSGVEDSEGQFTLAVDKASWKLASYLLATPAMLPVHLLASAAASGASKFHLFREGNVDVFQFDGEPFTIAELERLSLPLAGSSLSSRVRDLGVVLNVGGALGELHFESEGVSLTLSQDREVRLGSSPSEPNSGQKLTLEYRKPPVELRLLDKLGRLAPLDLQIMGRAIREPDDLGMSAHQLYAHYFREGSKTLMVRQARFAEYPIVSVVERERRSRSLAIALTWPGFANTHGWIFVANGVSYKLENSGIQFPFACGTVEASDLPRDLAGSGFVEGSELEAVWREIEEGLEKLITAVCMGEVDMSPNQRDLFNLEIEKRYSSRKPVAAISAYLARSETLDSPRTMLQKTAVAAARSGDWQVFESLLKDQRRKASLSYGHGLVENALAWLKREAVALRHADKSEHAIHRLQHYLALLHQLKPEFPLPEASSAACQFRFLLCTLEHRELSQAAQELEEIEVDRAWKAPLLLLVERLSGTKQEFELNGEWALALALWDSLEQGEFHLAWRLTEQLESGSPAGRTQAKVWRLIVVRLFRGRMSFLQSCRWQANHNLEKHFTYGALEKRARTLLPESRKVWEQSADLLGALHIQSVYLPILMGRLMWMARRGDRQGCLRLLARALLQCSILDQGSLTAGELPNFSQAFPATRLYGDGLPIGNS